MVDLSGTWFYNEDFHYGKDKGIVVLKQKGKKIEGVMHYVESINDEDDFSIMQVVKGEISSDNVVIKGVDYKAHSDYEEIDYQLDDMNGMIVSNNLIVGVSQDAQGVGGIFVLQR